MSCEVCGRTPSVRMWVYAKGITWLCFPCVTLLLEAYPETWITCFELHIKLKAFRCEKQLVVWKPALRPVLAIFYAWAYCFE